MELGKFYLVRFRVSGTAVYHERFVAGLSSDGRDAAIVTPDRDHYVEPCAVSPASVAVVHILDGQGGTVAGVPEARCYRFVELFEEHEYVGFFASGASLLGVPLPLPPYRVEFSGNNVAGRVAGWWQFGPPRPPEHVVARPPPAVQSLLPSRGSGAVDSGLAGLASALGAVEDGVGGGAPLAGGGGDAAPWRGPSPRLPPAVAPPDLRVLAPPTSGGNDVGRDFRDALALLTEDVMPAWGVMGAADDALVSSSHG